MDNPKGLTLQEMKELVKKLNGLIIDREMALAAEKANHDGKEENSE